MNRKEFATYIKDKYGDLYHFVETPNGLTFESYVNIAFSELTSLPEGLRFERSLQMRDSKKLISLPKDLFVWGWFDLRNCSSLTSLPENLTASSLVLRGTGITELPKGLNIRGYLNLEGLTLYPFPEDMKVGGIAGDYTIIPNSKRFITEDDS